MKRSRNVIAVLAISLISLIGSQLRAENRPNIVVILCDDLGYGDLECYGHPHIKTPHLNRLAKDGIRFTDFYSAAPVCSPSRVGLMTGRSPNRAGVYDWIPPGKDVHLRSSEVTLAQLLQQSDYATCMSGKWHCNGKFNSPAQPQPGDAGFDHWFGTQNNANPSHADPVNFVRNGEPVGPMEGFSCQIVVDEALTWLDGQQEENPEQPFFMYVAFHEPHEPVASPQDLVDLYRPTARSDDEAQYFANVANVDAAVGKLMAGLKAQGVDENTLVIFTSDNGPETLMRYPKSQRSFGVADPLRGMKLWTTDAGFRVAGIMRWPAQIAAGQVVRQPVSSLDFLPTFSELAGTKPPADLVLDGTSFLPALQDETIEREKPLLWAYYAALNERQIAMRDGDWKLLARVDVPRVRTIDNSNESQIKGATLSGFQLFNVIEDVSESNDLAASHADKLAELTRRMKTHYRELLNGSHVWTADG